MANSVHQRVRRRLAVASALLFAAVALVARLQEASSATLQEKIALCVACHGEKGQSTFPNIPNIGGQPKLFVMYQLFFYREGRRKSEEMNTIAKDLTDQELDAIAEFVARLPPPSTPPGPVDQARYLRGADISQKRLCASCHNPDFSGREQMPRLAGQHQDYLLKSLKEYKAGVRVGTQAAMAEAVRGLDDTELADLAHYHSHFRP
jgi:cytochrome c553